MYSQLSIYMTYIYRLSITFISAKVNATTTWGVS